jgi:GNAT superfamily N-acetyltransferase
MDYEFMPYQPEMLGQIAALRFEQWLEEPSFVASYLAWKYEQNPYADRMRLYVALSDGKVVATRGAYGGLLSAGGDLFPVATASDNQVAPVHQGRGLSTRLTRFLLDDMACDGLDYALSMGANRTTQLLSRRSGWERVCAYRPLYWGVAGDPMADLTMRRTGIRRSVRNSRFYPQLRTAWAHLRRFKRRAAGSGESAFQRFDGWASAALLPAAVSVEQTPRPAQMAALVQEQERDDLRIRQVRDERYYAWRFDDPRSCYRFLFSEAAAGLDGFLVLQQRPESGEVAVVDWQFNDEQRWLDLLRTLIESGSLDTLSIWSATLPPKLLAGLETLGFRPGTEPDTRTHPARSLLVTSTRSGVPAAEWTLNGRSLVDLESWDLRMIFSDYY